MQGGEHLARIARLLDPVRGLITEQAVATDLQEVLDAFESLQAQLAPPPGTHVRPVTAGGVQSLVVSPAEDSRPTVLYLHGGAYIVGSAFGYQSHAGALAVAAQTGVLVPDYRLAPEHPFPAALEDRLRAYRWLIGRGMPAEEVVLAGDSSGAGLVMSLLLTLKQEHAEMPGAAVLFCPWLDLGQRLPVDAQTRMAAVPSSDEARLCAHAYLADHPVNDPIVDPLSADLTGLPPMLIQAATGDARIADAKALAIRAREHGVDARLEVFPVDAHAFQLFWSFLPEAAGRVPHSSGVALSPCRRRDLELGGMRRVKAGAARMRTISWPALIGLAKQSSAPSAMLRALRCSDTEPVSIKMGMLLRSRSCWSRSSPLHRPRSTSKTPISGRSQANNRIAAGRLVAVNGLNPARRNKNERASRRSSSSSTRRIFPPVGALSA